MGVPGAHSGVGEGIFHHPHGAGLPLALHLDQIICPGQELNARTQSGLSLALSSCVTWASDFTSWHLILLTYKTRIILAVVSWITTAVANTWTMCAVGQACSKSCTGTL